ncbi:vWA domain-containing protein [Ktedonosporobacter rubrisoli]|nr:VWA domain-containing protein [Ktedonosporobacter rubrisoli]
MEYRPDTSNMQATTPSLTLNARPERHFIHPHGCCRFVAFHIHVACPPADPKTKRPPLELALVLDRSGSMSGEKLQTAKRAVLTLLDRLTPRDRVSVVVFDNAIDIVQPLNAVTPGFKLKVRNALRAIQARASTALHEGWLTGCDTLAATADSSEDHGLARCFLLTDGIANVGVTDPEQIASEAAGIREHAAISTSTFGIGLDYNELLLGPMAVAGGGQFHHLRTSEEIVNTFTGELEGLFSVAARQVRLEIEADPGINTELLSSYWMRSMSSRPQSWSIAIGDLQRDEDRQVIAQIYLPAQDRQEQQVLRTRLAWHIGDVEYHTAWQELSFSYADPSTCDAEARDAQVIHWAGWHQADRARRETVARNNRGDIDGARKYLKQEMQQIKQYGYDDKELLDEIAELGSLRQELAHAPMSPDLAKEQYYRQQLRSRGQADYRTPEE